MEQIIDPVERQALRAELTPSHFVRTTHHASNEIYIFKAAESPSLMREVGRLREVAFRAAGGGTGRSLDIDHEDFAEEGYRQLIIWDPAREEIVGGYRYIICDSEHPTNLSTERYFRFSRRFRHEFLPYTIELGRSFVQTDYQTRRNPKSIYALDNLWDGLGAIVARNPSIRYLFGKVTIYACYNRKARNALMWFLRRFFPDYERLIAARSPLNEEWDHALYEHIFSGCSYEENYKILLRTIREHGESIPPLINSYMNLSRTMRVFDTVRNPDFGNVEETGIMLTIPDIYPEKRARYIII